jgi:tRNA threonylcarbamoyladenosine biosynthesis protein TsaE
MKEPNWKLKWELESNSPAETAELGRRLGQAITSGPLVIGLVGPLGAGKTLFVRAVAEGLEVPEPRLVTSPTFVLIHEYFGRLSVYHFDAYRLKSAEQFDALGPDEYFESAEAVCLVEWADRVADSLPVERAEVHFAMVGPQTRHITLKCNGPACAVLEAVKASYTSS